MKSANVRKLWASATGRGIAIVALLLIPGSIAILSGSETSPTPFQGLPFYPDLHAIAPADLYLSTEVLDDGQSHHLLRFSTSVTNDGEGPLELVGSTVPGSEGAVSQVVTDAPFNGDIVATHDLGIDLIDHPEHHHFHLDHFATYELLVLRPDGTWVATGSGGKQSSCVLDNFHDGTEGPEEKQYRSCTLERQGLSVGWTDTYAASLPGQWIDLGSEPLPDGTYSIRYVVDPLAQISEDGRVDNNVATTRFDVQDGAIVGLAKPPRCTVDGDSQWRFRRCGPNHMLVLPEGCQRGRVLECLGSVGCHRGAHHCIHRSGRYRINGRVHIPEVPTGAYTVAVVAFDPNARRHVSTTVILGVDHSESATPSPAG